MLGKDIPSLDTDNPSLDKDRPNLDQVKNLHEVSQIVSYRPENHRIRLEILRPGTWDH